MIAFFFKLQLFKKTLCLLKPRVLDKDNIDTSHEENDQQSQKIFQDKHDENNNSENVQDMSICHTPKIQKPILVTVSRLKEEFYINDPPIGKGDFGEVFAAQNRLDGLYYAIKISKKPFSGSREETCAIREVMAHAVLGHHKHIVHYYSAWSEVDESNGAISFNKLIIQNEYCNGGSLAGYINFLRKD